MIDNDVLLVKLSDNGSLANTNISESAAISTPILDSSVGTGSIITGNNLPVIPTVV